MKQEKGLKSSTKGLSQGKGFSKVNKPLTNNIGLKQRSKGIKCKSATQKQIDKDLKSVYKEMDKWDDICCTGCKARSSLSHSHIIPRSRRRDLITDPKNITFHCHDCHDIWEHGTLEKKRTLDDFEENMKYISLMDYEYYNIILLSK